MTTTMTFAKVQKVLAQFQESAERDLAKFQEKFSVNPAYAFEWASSTFDAAGMQEVAVKLSYILTAEPEKSEEERVSRVLRYAQEELVRLARNPGRSTSSTSNLIAESRTKAYAEVLDVLTRGF